MNSYSVTLETETKLKQQFRELFRLQERVFDKFWSIYKRHYISQKRKRDFYKLYDQYQNQYDSFMADLIDCGHSSYQIILRGGIIRTQKPFLISEVKSSIFFTEEYTIIYRNLFPKKALD